MNKDSGARLLFRGVTPSVRGAMGSPPYSVFVGNVPYDATEERLRDMFSEVGPVHAFRYVNVHELP